MCPIICSVACQGLQLSSTLSHKGKGFGKKLLNTKCAIFSLKELSEIFLVQTEYSKLLMKMHLDFHVK